jgi:DNA-binding NarL/FixJ family response regulator
MTEPFEGRVYAGLIASHSLAARYLRDAIIKLGIDPAPLMFVNGVLEDTVPVNGHRVIIIDLYGLALPVSTYLDAFREHRECCSFIALDREQTVADVVQLLQSGFSGFVSHDEVPQVLGLAIDAVARGCIWTAPEVMPLYLKLTAYGKANGVEILTKRERQILDLLRKRYSNREMASFLGISESTVKFHVSNVMSKQSVRGRRELTESILAQTSVVRKQIARHLPPARGGARRDSMNRSAVSI